MALPHRDQLILSARYENNPIGLYPASYFEEQAFLQRVLGWCAICGITEPPDEVNLMLLMDILQNDFGGLTFPEIEVALKMNALEEFEVPVPTFNKLNIPFFGKVISQYKKHRLKADKEYQAIIHQHSLPAPVQKTEIEADMDIAAAIVDDYESLKQEKGIWGLASKYDFLERIGIFSMSSDAKKEAYRDARAQVSLERGAEWTSRNPDKHHAYSVMVAKEMLMHGWFVEIWDLPMPLLDKLRPAVEAYHQPNGASQRTHNSR